MKEYTLTEDQIEDLRELFSDDSHSKHHVRVEVMKNILPELFENSFEVGKYYEYIDGDEDIHFVFKLKELKKLGDLTLLWGYGLDFYEGGVVFKENCSWIDDEDIEDLSEITQEEFMNHIKNYAIEELGFKEGVTFNGTDIYTNLEFINSKIKGDIKIGTSNEIDYLECEVENGFKDSIFQDGKFAEIIKQPTKTPTSILAATNNLRYVINSIGERVLQQKRVNVETGEEKWDYIETV